MHDSNNPKNAVAPEGTKHCDPAPKCPDCGADRYWSDYWTDEFEAICVKCVARGHAYQPKVSARGEQMNEPMDFNAAMDAIFAGKVLQHDHQGWRDLGRKILRNPHAKKDLKRVDITKNLVKSENGELTPYKIMHDDKIAMWVVG